MNSKVEAALEALEIAQEMADEGTEQEQQHRMDRARELMIEAGFTRIAIGSFDESKGRLPPGSDPR